MNEIYIIEYFTSKISNFLETDDQFFMERADAIEYLKSMGYEYQSPFEMIHQDLGAKAHIKCLYTERIEDLN